MSTVSFSVSAPANVMLLGEHAVLHGHTAIACALSPRISVQLTPRNDTTIVITSQLATFAGSSKELVNETRRELSFVRQAILTVIGSNIPKGFSLSIDSEFSHTVGLGSSAAVVAACVAVLQLWQQKDKTLSPDNVFTDGLAVIHAVQQRGSGSDLAASVYGGLVAYRPQPRYIQPLLNFSHSDTTPNELFPQLDLFYCGYKTPTPEVIAHVNNRASNFPEVYQSLYQQMGNISTMAQQAISQGNWAQLGELMNIYNGLMDALGVSDHALSDLTYRARSIDSVMGAKISGSGLGDCIITLSKPQSCTSLAQLTAPECHIGAHISPYGIVHHA